VAGLIRFVKFMEERLTGHVVRGASARSETKDLGKEIDDQIVRAARSRVGSVPDSTRINKQTIVFLDVDIDEWHWSWNRILGRNAQSGLLAALDLLEV